MMNEMLQVHLVLTHCKKCLLHDAFIRIISLQSPHRIIVFTRTDNNVMHYADKVQSIQSIQAVSEAAYRQHITSDFIVSRIVNYKFTLLFVSNLSLWSYP